VGSIQTRTWTDQQGQKRYATEVVADEAYFVDSKGDLSAQEPVQSAKPQTEYNTSGGYNGDNYATGTQESMIPPPAPYTGTPKFEDLADDEELPF
jgi:single-strand DNA-binding protein